MNGYGNQVETPVAVPTAPTQDVKIFKASNGFVCIIGCKTFVAKTWEELSKGLALYFKDPSAARKKYCEDEVSIGN